MTITITYKNGEFTCTFTPDGEASIQVNGVSALTANADDAELEYQETDPDNEETAEDIEITISDQDEFSKLVEEDRREIDFDDSRVVPAVETNGVVKSSIYLGQYPRIKDHTA